MNFKKNLGAKIAACIASISALAAVWGLIRQNPPPPATTAQAESSPAAATPTVTQRKGAPAATPVTAQRHTRTRVS